MNKGFGFISQLKDGSNVIYEGNPQRAIIYKDGKNIGTYHVKYYNDNGVNVMCPDFDKPL